MDGTILQWITENVGLWAAILFVAWVVLFFLATKFSADDHALLMSAITSLHARIRRWNGRLMVGIPEVLIPRSAEQSPPPPPSRWWFLNDWYMSPRPATTADRNDLKSNPWSWPVLAFAMRVAVAYPIGLAFAAWAIAGGAVELGGAPLFPDQGAPWLRQVLIYLIAAIILLNILYGVTSKPILDTLSNWLIAAALAFAFLGAFTGVFATTGAFAIALASGMRLAFAFAFALTFAFVSIMATVGADAFSSTGATIVANAVSLAASLTLGATLAIAVSKATRGGKGLTAHVMLVLVVMVAAATYLTSSLSTQSLVLVPLTLGLVLLPSINAIFDWASYGTTLWLLRGAYTLKATPEGVVAEARGLRPVFNGFLDLIAAIVIFTVLGATLVTILSAINAARGEVLIDPVAILAAPSEHLWVIAMVASTLLPTLIHMSFGALSWLTFVPPALWQKWITRAGTDAGGTVAAMWLATVAVAIVLLTFGSLGLGIAALWVAGACVLDRIAALLLDLALWLSATL